MRFATLKKSALRAVSNVLLAAQLAPVALGGGYYFAAIHTPGTSSEETLLSEIRSHQTFKQRMASWNEEIKLATSGQDEKTLALPDTPHPPSGNTPSGNSLTF